MGIGEVLSRLKGYKSTGPDRWQCKCPAHQDKSPSMTLRLVDDGRILIHCFAGCGTDAILDALGLTFGDLFPEPLTRTPVRKIYQPFSAMDALRALSEESAIVAFAASDLVEGKPLSAGDADRVAVAAGRIASALEATHGA